MRVPVKVLPLVHAHTVRLLPHSSSDDHRKYRDEEDLETRQSPNDPIARLAEKLMDAGYATETELDILREEVKNVEIDEDTQWVLAQDEPKAEDGVRYMYSEKEPWSGVWAGQWNPEIRL